MKTIRKWTENEMQFVIDNYADMDTREMAFKLHRSVQAVATKASLLKIKKSDEYNKLNFKKFNLNASKNQFKKGHIPFNKGVKMSLELRNKVKHTFFKKGHVPANYMPVGSERPKGEGYIYVKVADPNVWKLKQRLIYEQHYGEIPENMNVMFIDNNRHNFDINNLKLIDNRENMRMNSVHNLPASIKQMIILLKRIKNKIRDRKK